MLDGTLARGIARQTARQVGETSNAPRQRAFLFAKNLVTRLADGRKIDGSAFNVGLAALMKAVTDNPSNLSVVIERLKLGRPGIFHRIALETEAVGHFRHLTPEFARAELAVTVDDIQADRGGMSAHLWTAPVLFDTHFLKRHLQRSRAARATASQAISQIHETLPLAVLIRDAAMLSREAFTPCDAVIPTSEGVMCGGAELVNCEAFAYKIQMGRRETGWGLDVELMPTTLQMAVCVRTFLSYDTLSDAQTNAVSALHQWYSQNRERILAEPRTALGWTRERSRNREALLAEFRQVYSGVLAHFRSWNRQVSADKYADIDWRSIAANYPVPEVAAGLKSVGAETIARYLQADPALIAGS